MEELWFPFDISVIGVLGESKGFCCIGVPRKNQSIMV